MLTVKTKRQATRTTRTSPAFDAEIGGIIISQRKGEGSGQRARGKGGEMWCVRKQNCIIIIISRRCIVTSSSAVGGASPKAALEEGGSGVVRGGFLETREEEKETNVRGLAGLRCYLAWDGKPLQPGGIRREAAARHLPSRRRDEWRILPRDS